MKYQIGDLVSDDHGESGIVIIKWDDGDLSTITDDPDHPNLIFVGHWEGD